MGLELPGAIQSNSARGWKIVNKDMEDVSAISKGNIIALAVYFGRTRLIDNYIIGEKLC